MFDEVIKASPFMAGTVVVTFLVLIVLFAFVMNRFMDRLLGMSQTWMNDLKAMHIQGIDRLDKVATAYEHVARELSSVRSDVTAVHAKIDHLADDLRRVHLEKR